jgi:proline dehydrogenase
MDPIKPNFDNTEIAFKGLSNDQLQKADRLFTLFNNPFLVSVGSSLTETALNWGLPIQGIVKSMVFDHFCGGETLEECKTLIDALGKKGVGVLLNFGVEAKQSEEEYDLSMQQNLDAIAFAGKERNVKALCMKITGFGRFELFEKMQSAAALTTDEQAELDRVNARFDKICAFALEQKVSMYVDAEESWIQDVLDEMTLIRMAKYNKTQAILSNTYQLYRHDVLAHFRRDIERAEKEGFILGAKLVRGAYVEKENEYAKAHQLPSKIHPNKTATDADFNAALRYAAH